MQLLRCTPGINLLRLGRGLRWSACHSRLLPSMTQTWQHSSHPARTILAVPGSQTTGKNLHNSHCCLSLAFCNIYAFPDWDATKLGTPLQASKQASTLNVLLSVVLFCCCVDDDDVVALFFFFSFGRKAIRVESASRGAAGKTIPPSWGAARRGGWLKVLVDTREMKRPRLHLQGGES